MPVQPYIGWDLRIHPKELNKAFWEECADKHRSQDRQVGCYLLLALAIMSLQHLSTSQGGLANVLPTCATAGLVGLVWMLLLRWPVLYSRHRVAILAVLRLAMCFATLHHSRHTHLTDVDRDLRQTSSPSLTLVMRLLLASNAVHIAIEAVRLQMPMAAQAFVTTAKALVLLSSGVLQGLVANLSCCHTLRLLRKLNASWAFLVESGQDVNVADDPILQGRCSAVVLAVSILYSTTVCITLYLCYISLWADVCKWLFHKATGGDESSESRSPARASRVNFGNGVTLSEQQLHAMCASPAAPLLLARRGLLGHLLWLCMHGCAVNLICLACVLLSQFMARQLLPALLPGRTLDTLYPQLLEACSKY